MAQAPVAVVLFGEWVSSDSLRSFEYQALKLDGTPYDLTGYTVRLQGRSQDNAANKIDVAGTVTTPLSGLSEFSPVGTALTLTPGKRREMYRCEIEWTRTSDSKKVISDPFALAVRATVLATT